MVTHTHLVVKTVFWVAYNIKELTCGCYRCWTARERWLTPVGHHTAVPTGMKRPPQAEPLGASHRERIKASVMLCLQSPTLTSCPGGHHGQLSQIPVRDPGEPAVPHSPPWLASQRRLLKFPNYLFRWSKQGLANEFTWKKSAGMCCII